MAKKSLIIDNAGFDIEAMSALTEKEFVDIHKDNTVYCRGKSEAERVTWLKQAYKAIKEAAKPVAKEEKVKAPAKEQDAGK